MTDDAVTPDPNLSGKVALVTGGARGLGLEIRRRLAALGAHVVVGARDQTKADKVAAELRSRGREASALKLDVTGEMIDGQPTSRSRTRMESSTS
jgi:NAD(P)-dependent dehydrogenase (short-subunit alcohol dehydrogenase family)